jgi:hypothetical protein
MHLDEPEIMRLSGYERQADMRRWIKANPLYRLNPPGKAGRVSATYVGPYQQKAKTPNFAALTAKGSP